SHDDAHHAGCDHGRSPNRRSPRAWLTSLVERGIQVIVDRLLVDTERPPHADRREFTGVNEAVDSHLGYAHDLRDLGNRQKGSFIFSSHIHQYPSALRALRASPPTVRSRIRLVQLSVVFVISATIVA